MTVCACLADRNLVDLVKAPTDRTVTRRLKRIPGVLKLKTQQLKPNEHCPHTLTPNLYKVNPWSPDNALLTVVLPCSCRCCRAKPSDLLPRPLDYSQ